MPASLKLLPGSTVRWRGRRYLIVDYESLERNHCATAGQAQTRTYPGQRSSTGSCVPYRFRLDTGPCVGTEEAWQKAVKRFKILKPLLNMGNSERTFAHIKKAARALGKHPLQSIDG